MEEAAEFVTRMREAELEAQAALKKAAEDMARFYDRDRNTTVEFEVGDKVWLDSRDIKTTRPMKKLDDKWFGPFPITHKYSRNAYRLELPPTLRIHPTFHISLLRRVQPDDIPGRMPVPPPPPITRNGHAEYEVEAILESVRKGRWKKLWYFVSWKNYDASRNTWEPEENLANARDLVEEFHRRNPGAPR